MSGGRYVPDPTALKRQSHHHDFSLVGPSQSRVTVALNSQYPGCGIIGVQCVFHPKRVNWQG